MEDTESPEGPLNQDEEALLADFRRCSPRRQDAIISITRKFAELELPADMILITTNILPFRRRKDE